MKKLKKPSENLILRTNTEKLILSVCFVLFALYALSLILPMIFTGYNSLKSMHDYNYDPFNFPGIYEKCPACKDPNSLDTCADFDGMCQKEIDAYYAAQKAATGSEVSAFFKTAGKVISNMFTKAMHWDNYVEIFDEDQMTVSIPFAVFNTIWRTVGSVCISMFFTACTSYVVCKYCDDFRWLKWVYAFVVTIMIIPVLGSTAASYEINHNILQIANKPWLYWVGWTTGIGFSFLMLYSAWQSLSWTYAEAAFIDGASDFQVFFKIMLPMIKPVLSALFVVNFIGGWSEYMETILYMDEWPSLGYLVYILQERSKYFGMPMYFAVIVVSVIPTLCVFVGFQETIMKNVTAGGLKG